VGPVSGSCESEGKTGWTLLGDEWNRDRSLERTRILDDRISAQPGSQDGRLTRSMIMDRQRLAASPMRTNSSCTDCC